MGSLFRVTGSFKNTDKFLKAMSDDVIFQALETYGEEGVAALQAFTPKDSGITADSWSYQIEHTGRNVTIRWLNDNVNKGYNIAILIQYGHGTGTGGYVVGRDYINPAILPTFNAIAEKVWKAVTSA